MSCDGFSSLFSPFFNSCWIKYVLSEKFKGSIKRIITHWLDHSTIQRTDYPVNWVEIKLLRVVHGWSNLVQPSSKDKLNWASFVKMLSSIKLPGCKIGVFSPPVDKRKRWSSNWLMRKTQQWATSILCDATNMLKWRESSFSHVNRFLKRWKRGAGPVVHSHAFIHYFTSSFNQKIDDITWRKLYVPPKTIRSPDASGLNTICSNVWLPTVPPDLDLFLWKLAAVQRDVNTFCTQVHTLLRPFITSTQHA